MLKEFIVGLRTFERQEFILSKIQLNIMKFRVLIEQDEDGVFIASVPELPGCISQGKTRSEAISNITDAIQGYLISLKKHNEPIPHSIIEEMVEVNA
jgi:predicted RNase H-like HicB family nuclease